MVIAHVAGVPMEELLPLAYGSGAVWLVVRVWGFNRAEMVRRSFPRLRRQRVDFDRELSSGRDRTAEGATTTVEALLTSARERLDRLPPDAALRASRRGAALIDIRSEAQQRRNGLVPGATVIPRNILEWRLDPSCPNRDPAFAKAGTRVILICDEGYQSSLAAATLKQFGLDATDVVGGFQAWLAAGLPVEKA